MSLSVYDDDSGDHGTGDNGSWDSNGRGGATGGTRRNRPGT
ncbi:hypothetical protein ACIHFE_21735 [Streptomyces sp. NPDC052396]